MTAGQLGRLELRHRVQIAFRIVWMHERGCVGPLELLPRISRQLAERPVDAQEATLEITSNAHQPESDRRILEGAAKVALVAGGPARLVTVRDELLLDRRDTHDRARRVL